MTTGPEQLQTSIPRPIWLPEAEWPFQIQSVLVDGCRLHLIDEGSGPVLLLVHAGMWSFVWRDLVADLARDFRCVAVDFPGSGLTDLTLVAHDLGGVIGLGWAVRHPEQIRGLAVINGFGWPPRPALRRMLKLMGGATMRRLNTTTNVVPRLTAGRFGVGRHLDRQARQAFLGPTRDRVRRLTFHRLMRDASRADPLLERIEIALGTTLRDRPLLTIFGQYNDPFRFQARWRELFPHTRQVVVARGNHFPMNDDPQGVAAAIRSWWQEGADAAAR